VNQVLQIENRKSKIKNSLTVALAGNPNAGKTTLFNALTGLRQKVANYAGVTVERKEGFWRIDEEASARLVDLPGLYSLQAASLDEQIARDVLTGQAVDVDAPDVIVAVVDATNLDRNLYLVTQLLEFRIPTIVALTMVDEAERRETEIDAAKLSKFLQVPVVPVVVSQRRGLEELSKTVLAIIGTRAPVDFSFFKTNGNKENGDGRAQILARYAWIADVVQESVKENKPDEKTFSEKLDRILTHKFFGLLILASILLFVFQTIFSFASLPMDLLDAGFGALSDFVRNGLPPGLLTDLLVDGVIAGVGGVLVFLPQIILLFFFISILEDTGYMARAAFLLDRLMRGVGLHGKAFVPLLSSFACAIPGVMATRTIENSKDRLATILIAPLMSCSARLPVYTLMIAAFFSGQYIFSFLSVGALLILAMYLLGIVTAIAVAFILKRTLLRAPAPPLVLELPPYRMPNFRVVFLNVFQRAGMFVKRAGTIILAISILLWALTTFPRTEENVAHYDVSTTDAQSVSNNNPIEEAVADAKVSDETKAGEQLRNSYAGRLGHLIEPLIAPLGFDWKMGVALIASFAAREVLVSTLSILYNVGKDAEADSDSLISAVRDAKKDNGSVAWTPLTALTMMVFFVLACQCMSTVAVVRRETNSWKWTAFMVVYMTALAYAAAFLTFQIGKLFYNP
jgi:ferrous iron transport protein B